MGTRSLTAFIHKFRGYNDTRTKTKESVVMYRQYDGYPSGHGLELAKFLLSGRPTRGIPVGVDGIFFNGIDDLAAWAFAHFKKENGGIYLHPAGTRDLWEDYLYKVFWEEDNREIKIRLEMWGNGGKSLMFDGSPQEFLNSHKEIS